ncbi:MAG: hypothetical protein VX438_09195, partial [Planctomycetota bacterium]|nr:hypothetical protein [Planctomycetota bacterium]
MDTLSLNCPRVWWKNAKPWFPGIDGDCGLFCIFVFAFLVQFLGIVHGQNSGRITRVTPNEVSAKIGSAVNWSPSLTDALEASKKTGKPIFWYISTVPGTFMDRKTEIDRYMLGGPFSWPPIIQILNDHFVPLKMVPRRKHSQFGIRPYEFVEPGFLILKPDSTVVEKVDRITTFQYDWLQHLLTRI